MRARRKRDQRTHAGHPMGRFMRQLSTACVFAAALALAWGAAMSAALAAPEDVKDYEVTNAIELELMLDDAVDSNTVSVLTTEGIVGLSGTAGSILAKERTTDIAAATVGVRGVVNNISVQPSQKRSNEALRKAVKDALLEDPATDAYEINVSVANGVVTLTGNVDSWQEQTLAESVAKGVQGVTGLENRISVRYETERPDVEIEAEVKARLENDIRVDDYLVDVAVNDGKVTLSGTVGSAAEKTQSRMDAWVAGTKSVDASGLEVEWWARDEMRRKSHYEGRTDAEIEQAVQDAFLYDPRVLSFNPEVMVVDGAVTLRGVVDNLKAKRAAEQDARNVSGVLRVFNNLKVRPVSTVNDDALEESVATALREDPYVERYTIGVDAAAGWVTLSGRVNTSFEKAQAERLAESVKGVLRVFNQIDYDHEWTWKPDWEIQEDINSQFLWSPFVDGDQIDVAVRDGVATLTGEVQTWAERRDAEENAYEGGAKDVENNLTVAYRQYGPYGPAGRYGWDYPRIY